MELDGEPALVSEATSPDSISYTKTAITKKDNSYYSIGLVSDSNNYSKYLELFEKIISTFKFTQ